MRATVLVLVFAGVALAAAPPAELSPEQAARMRRGVALFQRARAEWKAGKQETAIATMEQVLTVVVSVSGKNSADTLSCLRELATWEEGRGQWAKAARHWDALARALGVLWGEDHWQAVDRRWTARNARLRAGWTEEQNRQWERARALNEQLADLWRKGKPTQALQLADEEMRLRRGLVGEKHPTVVVLLFNRAAQHRALQEHQAAVPLFVQAGKIGREVLGERHPIYLACLDSLATVHEQMGDFKAALPLYRKVLALTGEVHGRTHPSYASALNNLATLYLDLGDRRAALPLYQRALAVWEAAAGQRSQGYATALDNLALVYKDLGKHGQALVWCQQALAVKKEVVGTRHPSYARSLNNLARIHRDRGDHRAARPLYEQALAIWKATLGERHFLYAAGLNNLALVHSDRGDLDLALPLCQQALVLAREALGDRHPHYVHCLDNLAGLYHRLDRPGAAFLLQEQSLFLTRRALTSNAGLQSERQQLDAASSLRFRLDRRLSMADGSASDSHDHVLAWKGAVFVAQRDRRDFIRLQGDATTRSLANGLLDVTRELALLSSRPDARSRERVETLTRLKEEREARLAELSEPFRASRSPLASDRLRRTLSPGVALVDLIAYHGTDPSRPRARQKAELLLSAWVLRADGPTVRVELGPMRPIEEAISSWRRALEQGRTDEKAAARLRERVWEPLQKHLTGAKVVLLSPDGAVARLPFAALPGRKEGTYLLEEVSVVVVPVPRLLPRLDTPITGKPSLLALGGVDFSAELEGSPRKEAGGLPWRPLSGTAAEVKAIGDRFTGPKATLSGQAATRSAVRDALTRHRYAHLATHGFFAPATMRSVLERTDDRGDSLFWREGVSGWHPGLLSGLVLAGANRPTDEDDGVLKASEIAELDLGGLELAVLSACETGLGKEAGGEGLLGLQRAFAVAGARSVVSSLWSVNDAATSVLMERFYLHLWTKKLSKLESLRQAQLDVLRHPEWVEDRVKKLAADKLLFRGIGKASAPLPKTGERRSPPAWWAAWQLSGDWR